MLEVLVGRSHFSRKNLSSLQFLPLLKPQTESGLLVGRDFLAPCTDWPDFPWHLSSSTSLLGAGIKHHHPRPQLARYWNCSTRVSFWTQLQILNWELFYSHFYVLWQEKVLPLHQPALEKSLGTPLSPALGLILVFIIICVCQIPLSLWD